MTTGGNGALVTIFIVIAQMAFVAQNMLPMGAQMPEIRGRGLDGAATVVDFGSSPNPTVVYIIAPGTPGVQDNEPAFAALVRGAADRFQFVLLATSEKGLREYLQKVQPGWGGKAVRIVIQPDAAVLKPLAVAGSPHTFVVSIKGRVIQNITGQFVDAERPVKRRALEAMFSVKLPDK